MDENKDIYFKCFKASSLHFVPYYHIDSSNKKMTPDFDLIIKD